MRNHLWSFASLVVILALALAACSPAPAPSPTPAPTEAVQPQATSPSAPAPQATTAQATAPAASSSNTNPYPGPVAPIVYVKIDPYPAPVQGETIAWDKVAALLAGGGVSDVFQMHTLTVIINMNDGKTYVATEPAKDEIFKLLNQCGGPCENVKPKSEIFY